MPSRRTSKVSIGNEPPLLAHGRRVPDRREISLRWLSGTFLTGLTSCALMGVALFAAVDGREQLALPGEAIAATGPQQSADTGDIGKGARVVSTFAPSRPEDLEIMEVSTVFREGDRDVVRRKPFAHVQVSLAANHATKFDYPAFDPLAVFSETAGSGAEEQPGIIYGAQIDSEITLRTRDFPLDLEGIDVRSSMSIAQAEEAVRENGEVLEEGTVQVATLNFVDPQRFARLGAGFGIGESLRSRVITENVSVSLQRDTLGAPLEFLEDVLPVSEDTQIIDLMRAAGYSDDQASMVSGIFANFNKSSRVQAGDIIRVGVEQQNEDSRIVRASIYRDNEHYMTVAENDRGFFVRGVEPANSDVVLGSVDENALHPADRGQLPTIYDGVYRASLSHGMNDDMTADLVRVLANNVDLQSRLNPTDRLELFFSVSEETDRAAEGSELLMVSARFGDEAMRLYRFHDPKTGDVGYFDTEGKSVRPFLQRNPVPNGRFTSPFGMRRHPILGYSRMHSGVDWAAPTGTPIIAPGDGIVQEAGWNSGGYGRHTEIQHANGYITTYSHQSSIAKGVRAGATVKQGQVIGYVGTTGMSTGPHLHYEMIVNGSKVDPMRVRLPDSRSLEGEALAAFQQERRRIDELLNYDARSTEMAAR